jgi:hypothetical protein
MVTVLKEKLGHKISGRLYVASDAPEHETLESYKECVRRAYGSLRGVRFVTVESCHRDNVPGYAAGFYFTREKLESEA